MLNIYEFSKTILNPSKFDRDLKAHAVLGPVYSFFNIRGSDVEIHFSRNLVQSEIDACALFVNTFSDLSVLDTLNNYLGQTIDPFVYTLLKEIRAENISWGITQLGKTGEVLGFFETPIVLPGKVRAITLKGSLDTGSLTETVALVDYYVAHPELYSDLSPFVTAERLASWKNKILAYLAGA